MPRGGRFRPDPGFRGEPVTGHNPARHAMGRKSDKKPWIDLGGPVGGLTSNPFASLPRSGESATNPASPAEEIVSSDACDGGVVEVRFERKGRGGKEVTVARWLSEAPDDAALRQIARDCGRALGAGARIEAGSVVVQGRQVDRVASYLETSCRVKVKRGTS